MNAPGKPSSELPLAGSHEERATDRKREVWRNPLLWTLQGWLAMFYIGAGYAKLTEPTTLLIHMLAWPAWVPPHVVTAVGFMEVAVAFGMVAPALSWRAFHGVLIAAVGLILIMAAFMAGVHFLLGSPSLVAVNAALMVIALLVLGGRRRKPN